jgi:ribosomal protein S17E
MKEHLVPGLITTQQMTLPVIRKVVEEAAAINLEEDHVIQFPWRGGEATAAWRLWSDGRCFLWTNITIEANRMVRHQALEKGGFSAFMEDGPENKVKPFDHLRSWLKERKAVKRLRREVSGHMSHVYVVTGEVEVTSMPATGFDESTWNWVTRVWDFIRVCTGDPKEAEMKCAMSRKRKAEVSGNDHQEAEMKRVMSRKRKAEVSGYLTHHRHNY